MDQPGKVANPAARGQLNRKDSLIFSSLSPFAPSTLIGLARKVRASRPASAYSFSTTLRLNLVLSHNNNKGIPPAFRDDGGVHIIYCQPSSSGQSRV